MRTQLKVYFGEFNVLMDKITYLPLVSGLLRAYAETFDSIRTHYTFMPFNFIRSDTASVVDRFEDPGLAAFSLSMWNEQFSLRVAEEVKRRYPKCLLVFGGPQVPHYPAEYFAQFPFVDVTVRGEGEQTFASILERFRESRDFSAIPGISWRDPATGRCVRNDEEPNQPKDLDCYPSPYIEGLYDDLFAAYADHKFQAIIETNRGCPFRCSFCFWGQGSLNRKFRYHGLSRVRLELEWCARNEICYVFNADSNFGMHKRDIEIARMLVELKREYGYPEKFRSCFGKNTDQRICDVAEMLHKNGLEKGITLSFQSLNPIALKNIRRTNIKVSTYEKFQRRLNQANIPTYTEFILGLPGETYESLLEGIEAVLQAGLTNQFFIYPCQIYPNTHLANPEVAKRFEHRTIKIALTEVHGAIRAEDSVTEFEELLIETYSMPLADWRKAMKLSWTTMFLYSMKVGYFVILYLSRRLGLRYVDLIRHISEGRISPREGTLMGAELTYYDELLDDILAGKGRCQALPDFGHIYWDEEEASFLRVAHELERFYDELRQMTMDFVSRRGVEFEPAELDEVFHYQYCRIPSYYHKDLSETKFDYNIPEYFELLSRSQEVELRKEPQELIVRAKRYDGDKHAFARDSVLWGRKSGTILTEVVWRSLVGA